MRMRASVVIPGAAEGVAPPDAEPVTIHEALEVLGEQVCLYVYAMLCVMSILHYIICGTVQAQRCSCLIIIIIIIIMLSTSPEERDSPAQGLHE